MRAACLQVGNGIYSFSKHCFGVIYNNVVNLILPGVVSVESFAAEIVFEEAPQGISVESFAAEIILLE